MTVWRKSDFHKINDTFYSFITAYIIASTLSKSSRTNCHDCYKFKFSFWRGGDWRDYCYEYGPNQVLKCDTQQLSTEVRKKYGGSNYRFIFHDIQGKMKIRGIHIGYKTFHCWIISEIHAGLALNGARLGVLAVEKWVTLADDVGTH